MKTKNEFFNWQDNPYSLLLASALSVWSVLSHRDLGIHLIWDCLFSPISQASLLLPVIFLQAPLPIRFCHYFPHISVSSAVFPIAVPLCSPQTVSDISYATLQDLPHDQFGDHSCLSSISIQKFLSSVASCILGISCCHHQFSFTSHPSKEI